MRNIPIALQAHLDQSGTTLTDLIKLNLLDGRVLGLTRHNKDITFDDGGGIVVYKASMNSASLKTNANLEVDNTETLMLTDIGGVLTASEIRNGVLDDASFWQYRINWNDLSQGYALINFGTTGIAKTRDQLAGVIELRGISQKLKQTFVDQYSITCRTVFGSQEGFHRFPCNFNADTLFTDGLVDTVDAAEPDRLFTATFLPVSGPNGNLEFVPGLIQFLTGANSQLWIETETVSGVTIELQFAVPHAIQVGDTFRMRPDCAKRWKEDCIDRFDNHLNFRGEPLIPLGEESPAGQPGANVPGFGTGILPGTLP